MASASAAAAEEVGADEADEETPAANSRWRVVSRAEVATYPVCPNCRWQSPPGFVQCSRCYTTLPEAVAPAAVAGAPRIGDYLLERGVLGPRAVAVALSRQRRRALSGEG